MKIAVLGASGWIGSHIAKEAASRGHEVVAIVRDSSKVEQEGVRGSYFRFARSTSEDQRCDI